MSDQRFKKADQLFSFVGMNQEKFHLAATKTIEHARTTIEKILCTLQRDGGQCPNCGVEFRPIHCSKMGSDYIFFEAGCTCFDTRRVKITAMDRALLKGEIPLKFWGKEWGSIRQELINTSTMDAFNRARDYCENGHYDVNGRKSGIIIYGDVGSGKTLASVLIAKTLIKKGLKVCFLSMPGFIGSQIKDGQKDYVEFARNFDVVILDDLTKERIKTDWSQTRIHQLIEMLDHRQKIVIITDEKNPGTYGNLFLDSIVSRLRGLVGGHKIHFQGKDFRPIERGL